jgi:hypothetical protein
VFERSAGASVDAAGAAAGAASSLLRERAGFLASTGASVAGTAVTRRDLLGEFSFWTSSLFV